MDLFDFGTEKQIKNKKFVIKFNKIEYARNFFEIPAEPLQLSLDDLYNNDVLSGYASALYMLNMKKINIEYDGFIHIFITEFSRYIEQCIVQ